MNAEQKYRFLDVGGGPDISEKTDITMLRATRLAMSDPNGNYYVLDPLISLYGVFFPNLHFVKSVVAKESSIPFTDETFNVVEMNFVFVPLSTSPVDQPLPLEEFQQWKEKELKSPKDVPLYARAIQESARVLKKDGKFILCEKKQRMDRIMRLLSRDSDLKLDTDFLRNVCRLEFTGVTMITDETRSWWTERRLKERKEYLTIGDFVKAEESVVLALEFRKI